MADDYYDYEDHDPDAPKRDHLFLWTVFILLLIGLAFASWLGSFYIFGHPERPQPYRLLKKLGKIEVPHRFEVTAAPPGEFLSAQKLFDKYSRFTKLQLEQENDELLRNYIKNYRETKKLVTYVSGRFEIVESYELQKTDLFATGVVAFAASTDFPQVLIEHVFTTAPENVVGLRANLPRGLDMRLEKTRDLAAVIHVERTTDGYLQFTVVPLLYGSWGIKGSVGVFSLEPPPGLNLEVGAPIIRGQVRQDAMHAYAEYRRAKRPEEPDRPGAMTEPELVRLDSMKPGTAVPATGALPSVPVATPIPLVRPGIAVRTPPAATPIQIAMAPARGTPIPVATPLPMTVKLPPPRPNVPLKPFIAAEPLTDFSTGTTRNWPTYGLGKHPFGRTVTPSEASALAERGELSERLYLRGNFVVTAAGESRAVLRAQGATGSDPSRLGTSNGSARVIVEFPPTIAPPAEGETFSRDESRGFEIRDVRRGTDGQVNIYVREITRAE